jgi:hypothetical protein
MKKILKWIKDHVRPSFKYKRPQKSNEDRIENLKENTQIGGKITFKF